jgi:prepilin-type N-terminal cleavage/methylation domain-containing protein/uncharacterized repeat protein (TIGR02543 family)
MGLTDTCEGGKNMRKNSGFTLIEVIVAIALIGIIATGIIPAFAAQYRMTLDTKSITVDSFDAQGGIERAIEETRDRLIDGSENGDSPLTLFGRTVNLFQLVSPFPSNGDKNYVVFLSLTLARMEQKQLLVAENVSIEVSGETVHQVADLKKSPKPTLVGQYDANTDPKWYTNIYRWYVSEEGNPSPKFPDDYERIALEGIVPPNLNDLSYVANRYVVFTVTPVDIHGVRGNEERSSNTVYVLGPEWRSGIFAWVDKNDDIDFDETGDVKVEKSANWALLRGFDTEDTFLNPANPDEWLDPGDGALYVPMGIDRIGSNRVGPIVASGSDRVEWIIDKSIHLATDITVQNSTDLHFQTRDGNITLYQYIELNPSTGDAVFQNGLPNLVNYGPAITTQSGDINFDSKGRSDVILQNYSTLDSGGDIRIAPYGHLSIYNSHLLASGSIQLDSSTGSLYSGNRDIVIQDSELTLKSEAATGRIIRVASRDGLEITDTDIYGNSSSPSRLELTAPDGVVLKNVFMHDIGVALGHTTVVRGGGWDKESTVAVPDDKQLIFQAADTKVNNYGGLDVGNTGIIHFATNMSTDLQVPLTISLNKDGSNGVVISTNYGRNVGYADSSEASTLSSDFRDLGTGNSNLEYAVFRVSGSDSPSLSLSFDGTDTAQIYASGTGPISSYFELQIRDKYADNAVIGSILFRVQAAEGESPTVMVIGSAIPTFTVAFDKNGGDTPPSPSSKTVQDGDTIGALPSPPSKAGYDFLSWNTQSDGNGAPIHEGTIISDNLTAYAQWAAYMTFAEINIGDYINVGGTSFQKISGDRVLARVRVGSTMNWNTAVTTANNYNRNFSAYPWVIGSGLLTNIAIDDLVDSYTGRILDSNYEWWGADPSSNNNATTVNTSGVRRTRNKNNNYGCRPYLRVNTANLFVDTGAGDDDSPYVLTTY